MSIVDQYTVGGVLRDHVDRLRGIERGGSPWVYVGTVGVDGVDDLITPESPPFTNGTNSFGAGAPVSFTRRNGTVYLRGEFAGVSAGQVIYTLPAGFRPAFQQPMTIAKNDGSTYATVIVHPNGDVVFVAIGAASSPNPSSAIYQFDAGVVASLGAVTVDWTYDTGDASLLDLTTPSNPIPVLTGVYAVMVELTSPDGTWTPGNNLVAKLEADGPLVNHHMEGSGTYDTIADPAHTRANAYVTAQMTGSSSNKFLLTVENDDSIAHNLIGHISVQRILAY